MEESTSNLSSFLWWKINLGGNATIILIPALVLSKQTHTNMNNLFWYVELLCTGSSSELIVMCVRTKSCTHLCARHAPEQILEAEPSPS